MNIYLFFIGMLLITAMFIFGSISINLMAKDTPIGPVQCDVLSDPSKVLCCQIFKTDTKTANGVPTGGVIMYCSNCDNTNPPENCGPRYPARSDGGDITTPPKGGISDDPQAGDDRNPGIPPTEGVTDETENNPSGNEDSSTTNTIPRKGGDGLNASDLNKNVISQ